MVEDGTRRGGRQAVKKLRDYLNKKASALAPTPNTVNDFVNQQVQPKPKASIPNTTNDFVNQQVDPKLNGISFLSL